MRSQGCNFLRKQLPILRAKLSTLPLGQTLVISDRISQALAVKETDVNLTAAEIREASLNVTLHLLICVPALELPPSCR